jgi:aromatic-L-amino-acid/L-tryptophan decarboxylase
MVFDLNFEQRKQLGYKLIDRINEYFSSLSDRPVQPKLDGSSRRRSEIQAMPEIGEDPGSVLEEVFNFLIDDAFHAASANYFGLQNPTPTYMSVLAEALVAALNPQLASLVHAWNGSKIEHETVQWIGSRVGWDGPFEGTFTSGGSEANFTALAIALAGLFPSVVEQGLAAIDGRPVFYTTAEAHHSFDKAAGLLGLGRDSMRRIPVTRHLQMDVDALVARIEHDISTGFTPFCVVATAGTTSSGAVDDIARLADVSRRYGLWFHVDGAYGGALILSDKHRYILQGIEQADSLTIDPHKWLATSMSAGMILTRHRDALWRVFAANNPFMPATGKDGLSDNFNVGLQWSRRLNSLKLWMTLRVHGRQAYEALIDRQMVLAQEFAGWITGSPQFELLVDPVLPSLNFRVCLPPGSAEADIKAANEAVVDAVIGDGRFWISTATVAGNSAIRMLVISYLSEARHLDELRRALVEAAEPIISAYTSIVALVLPAAADGRELQSVQRQCVGQVENGYPEDVQIDQGPHATRSVG